jgi:hypothetical protein
VPTSVLLAVLAAAGLLALAPALVRRYDATERLVAERAMSTARVIDRERRRRTVPGRRPLNPPRSVSGPPSPVPAPPLPSATPGSATPGSATPVSAVPVSPAVPVSAVPRPISVVPARRRRPAANALPPEVYRRRRRLLALVLLNVIELIGVGLVGPGFWIGSAPSLLMLGYYLVHLRHRAVVERRLRLVAARRAARIASRQAQLRREQARRLAARREALRRAAAARSAAQRESLRLSQRYVDGSARGPARGRADGVRAAGY